LLFGSFKLAHAPKKALFLTATVDSNADPRMGGAGTQDKKPRLAEYVVSIMEMVGVYVN
jgi:hypothetical protein